MNVSLVDVPRGTCAVLAEAMNSVARVGNRCDLTWTTQSCSTKGITVSSFPRLKAADNASTETSKQQVETLESCSRFYLCIYLGGRVWLSAIVFPCHVCCIGAWPQSLFALSIVSFRGEHGRPSLWTPQHDCSQAIRLRSRSRIRPRFSSVCAHAWDILGRGCSASYGYGESDQSWDVVS